MAALLPKSVKPNIIVIKIDDAPSFFYRQWDAKHPFREDGIVPDNTVVDPGSGTDIYLQTPRLDQLVSDGVTFLNAYAQPICGPDRACMFSGRWAHATGMGTQVNGAWEFNTVSGFNGFQLLPQTLDAAGYETALCGKWHLSTEGGTGWAHIPTVGMWDWYAATCSNFRTDFVPVGGPILDDLEPIDAGNGWTNTSGNIWEKAQAATTTPPFKQTEVLVIDGVEYATPVASAAAVTSEGDWYAETDNTLTIYWDGVATMERRSRMLGGHYSYTRNVNGTTYRMQSTGHAGTTNIADEAGDEDGPYSCQVVYNDAETYVASAQEPFFLSIMPNIPHVPREDMYPQPDSKINTARFATGVQETNNASYHTVSAAALEFHDTRMGEFFDSIPDDVWARTIVIFTSDNGAPDGMLESLREGDAVGSPVIPAVDVGATMDALLDASTDRFKNTPYEGAVRVPLVISGPAVKPSLRGSTSQALTHTVDLFATVCDIAGATAPANNGASLLPVVQGSATSVRSEMIVHRFEANGAPGDYTQVSGTADSDNFDELGYYKVFTDKGGLNGRYKLLRRYLSGGPGSPVYEYELYWLEDPNGDHDPAGSDTDRWEREDLWDNATYSAIQTEMLAGLTAILAT